jgi:hypothetical protein
MRQGAIVNLIVQRVLNKITLLFGAIGHGDTSLVNIDELSCETSEAGECFHLLQPWLAVRGSAHFDLGLWTDVANLTYSVVAIVIGNAVSKADAARRLPEQYPPLEGIEDTPFDCLRENFSTSDVVVEILDPDRPEMLPNLVAKEQAGEDSSVRQATEFASA